MRHQYRELILIAGNPKNDTPPEALEALKVLNVMELGIALYKPLDLHFEELEYTVLASSSGQTLDLASRNLLMRAARIKGTSVLFLDNEGTLYTDISQSPLIGSMPILAQVGMLVPNGSPNVDALITLGDVTASVRKVRS